MDPAITVDEEADRQSENPTVALSKVGVPDGHGVIHFELLIKGTHGARLIVEGNADDLQTLFTVSVLQIHESWNFRSAWRTPSCPEVEQNYPASMRGEIQLLTIQTGKREFRCERMISRGVPKRMLSRFLPMQLCEIGTERQSDSHDQKDSPFH